MPIDYKQYPKNWQKIRMKILIACDDKCEVCGAINHELHPITQKKVVLTIHHLNKDIKDNRYENLIAVCQRCHFAMEKTYKRHKKLEHHYIKKLHKAIDKLNPVKVIEYNTTIHSRSDHVKGGKFENI